MIAAKLNLNTNGMHCLRLGQGKADAARLEVKDAVVLAKENVTHNPQRAVRSRDIDTNESAQTLHKF